MAVSKLPIDEKKLIEQLQDPKSAHAAFDSLMRVYGEPVYWQIRKLVVRHEDADDLLQNVFLKAWLFKIAINESINFLNKERTRNQMNVEEGDDSYLLDNIQADEYFDGDELQAELLKAVAKLPEKQRLVFNMRYFDEMKYEEISEVLGTSVGALKASYHHAVKKIEEIFSES